MDADANTSLSKEDSSHLCPFDYQSKLLIFIQIILLCFVKGNCCWLRSNVTRSSPISRVSFPFLASILASLEEERVFLNIFYAFKFASLPQVTKFIVKVNVSIATKTFSKTMSDFLPQLSIHLIKASLL